MSETPEAIARRLHNMQCLVWDSCAAVDECECRDAIASAIAAERATRDELLEALRPFGGPLADLAEEAHRDESPLMLELRCYIEEFRAARAALARATGER